MFLHSRTELLIFSTFKGAVSNVVTKPNRENSETGEMKVVTNKPIVGNRRSVEMAVAYLKKTI
jgi:hypothetical protein